MKIFVLPTNVYVFSFTNVLHCEKRTFAANQIKIEVIQSSTGRDPALGLNRNKISLLFIVNLLRVFKAVV